LYCKPLSMADEWKQRLEQITGKALRDDADATAPDQVTYMGHVYVRKNLSADTTEVSPVLQYFPPSLRTAQANFRQVPYRQSWVCDPSWKGAAFNLQLTPVVPGTLEVYYRLLRSPADMARMIGKDDGNGVIFSTTNTPLAGTVYYNDGEVRFDEKSGIWTGPEKELLLRYKRLEVAQVHNRTARGGSIVSVNED